LVNIVFCKRLPHLKPQLARLDDRTLLVTKGGLQQVGHLRRRGFPCLLNGGPHHVPVGFPLQARAREASHVRVRTVRVRGRRRGHQGVLSGVGRGAVKGGVELGGSRGGGRGGGVGSAQLARRGAGGGGVGVVVGVGSAQGPCAARAVNL
jgi:hypothetical protein